MFCHIKATIQYVSTININCKWPFPAGSVWYNIAAPGGGKKRAKNVMLCTSEAGDRPEKTVLLPQRDAVYQ